MVPWVVQEVDLERQPTVRADKWLWAVRIFKTRGDAATACRLSQVTIQGQPVKPSRTVRADEVLVVEKAPIKRTLRVRKVLEKRVGAKMVETYLEDLTPPEVYEKAQDLAAQARQNRVYTGEEGGRPTKRDRRRLEAFESQEEPLS